MLRYYAIYKLLKCVNVLIYAHFNYTMRNKNYITKSGVSSILNNRNNNIRKNKIEANPFDIKWVAS